MGHSSAREAANQMLRNFGRSALRESEATKKKFENRRDQEGASTWAEISNAIVDLSNDMNSEGSRDGGLDHHQNPHPPGLAKVTCTFS